jgi:hypothetical protein
MLVSFLLFLLCDGLRSTTMLRQHKNLGRNAAFAATLQYVDMLINAIFNRILLLTRSSETRVVRDASTRCGEANVLFQDGNAGGQGGQLTHVGRWTYIAVKNGQGDGQCGDGIRHVHNATDPAFARDATQHQVHLLFCVAKLGQVLDAVQHGALVRDGGV